jgi:hypothetical protein
MKLIRNAFAAGIVAAATVMACSSEHGSSGPTAGNNNGNVGATGGQSGQNGTGTVGANLSLAPGVSLTSLNWTISNGTNSYTGTVHIGDAQSVEWVAGGILAGSGYSITITGVDSAGEVCAGSTTTTFAVAAGATTQVVLGVVCSVPSDGSVAADVNTGSVEVDASVTRVTGGSAQCPGITSFSIDPAEQLSGASSQLNLSTTGPASVITWSVTPATGGSFSSPNAANPTFTCSAPNTQMTITATIALPDSGACTGQTFTTMSAVFTCETGAVADSGTPPVDAGVDTGIDTGVDTGIDTGTVAQVVPCTTIGQTNCVTCPGSTNGLCTATEALIVEYDIKQNAQPAGAPLPTSCYECLITNACIDADGTTNGLGLPVTNAECGDPNGANSNPPFDSLNGSAANVAHCFDALTCALTGGGTDSVSGAVGSETPGAVPHCTTALSPFTVGNCFCGANKGSACITSAAAPIGVCASNEFTDLGTTDPIFATGHFADPTNPGGVANAILNCAVTALNGGTAACGSCFK